MSFIKQNEAYQLRAVIDAAELEAAYSTDPNIGMVSEMVNALDDSGRQYVLEKMAERYAVEIRKTKDAAGNEQSYQAHSKAAAEAAIKAGIFEVIEIYLYKKTNSERSLFKEQGSYTYSDNSEEFSKDLQEARAQASEQLSMSRVDSLAEAIGSSACLVQTLGNNLNYQPVIRDRIWIVFSDTLTSIPEGGGEGDTRPVNKLNIDECSVTVVQLGDADSDGKASFVAYYHKSELYPNGRQVQYIANNWFDVPEIHSPDAYDSLMNDEPYNPMVYASGEWFNNEGPQIPIVLWYNDTSGYGKTIMPITPDYYEQCKELSLDASRAMLSVLKSISNATDSLPS